MLGQPVFQSLIKNRNIAVRS